MNGYAGKILRINLTTKTISTLPTSAYEDWGGGHGMGSKIFWDLIDRSKLPSLRAYDPDNIVTLMTSPIAGTMVPGGAARTEVQGIGAQTYPEWFTHSNFGGRFSSMLKYAGWDGVVIEGRAEKPVWIDIRNDTVRIQDAANLWGLDTWQTQERIWSLVTGQDAFNNWIELDEDGSRTTQRPAVVCIGPAGEALSRTACLIHDAGNGAGQGGFGGVWGSKNLKAISVIGTGGISIADPASLFEVRLWAQRTYGNDLNHPEKSSWTWFGVRGTEQINWGTGGRARLHACIGCHRGCHERAEKSVRNDSMCSESFLLNYTRLKDMLLKTDDAYYPTSMTQKLGINASEVLKGTSYLKALYKAGVLGQGCTIDCDLPFDKVGSREYFEAFFTMLIQRTGIGNDFAEGFYRAAMNWGRLEEDLRSGILNYGYWGMPTHTYDPRCEPYWGYGTLLDSRDINEHCFSFIFWKTSLTLGHPPLDAEFVVNLVTGKMAPYDDDPLMLDFSDANLYSEHQAKLVAWHRHYSRFWKRSVLYCDLRWPDFLNTKGPGNSGLTPEGEPKFFNAVTGKNLTFLEGNAIGEKIWNLDNAIWTLQGRHRDQLQFAEFIYEIPFTGGGPFAFYYMPWYENGSWSYRKVNGRTLDRQGVEEFKTKFYKLEGWDTETGWPTRSTLERLGLDEVADELERQNRLGRE